MCHTLYSVILPTEREIVPRPVMILRCSVFLSCTAAQYYSRTPYHHGVCWNVPFFESIINYLVLYGVTPYRIIHLKVNVITINMLL